MRRLIALVPVAILLASAACGGSSNSNLSTTTPTPTQPIAGAGPNVATLTVDAGPSQNSVNTPYVSITVCTPGSTSNCQVIDHIEVDTASYGLRILSSVLNSSLALTQEMDPSGADIVECAVFGDGISWGPVMMADLQISGETASDIPVQVIGDPAFSGIPAECTSHGNPEDTVLDFGANGIIGVGPFIQDDGDYYTCTGGVCTQSTTVAVAQEVSNPVAYFAVDNNGVIVELPSVPAGGATALSGSLVFGIGTETNNGLGSATIYGLDPNFGTLAVNYKGTSYTNSVIDTGSNALYLVDSTIPTCSDGFFCPASTLENLTAINTGTNNATGTITFSVANADSLFSSNADGIAFVNLAAPNPDNTAFDWGLPFFFNRTVYTAIADQSTPGGTGPYIAY